ncbi:MAG: metallophosphoesterase [Fimbriimonadales bacterium]
MTRRSFLKGAACGMAGAVFTGAYADYSVHDTLLERVELRLKRWKADGLRVGFITDIHVNDYDEMTRALHAAKMLADTSPDILLFGGDCVNTKLKPGLEHTSICLEPFRKLRCPKLAVLGNHDYASKVPSQVEKRLTDSGFLVLKNETVSFGNYHVAGFDDRLWGKRDLAYQPRQEGTIALLHEPDFVDDVPETVSLQLSGHSHGGQICLPFGVPLHTPYGALKYRRGFFPDTKVPLYVSRGVGTTGFKWRLFCPPEVTLLTLRSA